MMKRWFIMLVPCMLAILLSSGCTGEFTSKTVIISEADEQSDPSPVHAEFEVAKIYQLADNTELTSETLGWFDDDHIVRLSGEREARLELVNYKNHARQHVQHVQADFAGTRLSPDGRYTVSVHTENRTAYMKLFDLQQEEETVIEQTDAAQTMMSSVGWSDNSRYVSFASTEVRSSHTSIVVYDVLDQQLNRYELAEQKERNRISFVKVSEQGKHALLVINEAESSIVVYGDLEGSVFTNRYEFLISHAEQIDFVNEDQIIFVDQNGLLTMFDQRKATSTILLDQIGIFQLTRDRKAIVYSQQIDNLYAAALQGNHIMNSTLIYKGMFPYQMEWSPDDRKLFINSRNSYPVEPQMPQVFEVTDQIPLIIEFQ